jgi:hypothetical protein
MLKTAVQQGRNERGPEEVHTALRVGRSPQEWILANGKAPTAIPASENLCWYVEGLNDARTLLGERCVLAHPCWAGEKRDFFSILLGARSFGRRQGLFENRAEAEVGKRIFEVGIQPLKDSHIGIGHVLHR